MGFLSELESIIGVRNTPWIMRIYFVLLLVCVGLIVFAATNLNQADPTGPMAKLFDFGMDNFKLVLGAVIGSLSTAATSQWGQPSQTPKE